MFAKGISFALNGLDGIQVEVEVDIHNGLPKFDIVGLPDAAVKESKERVRSAIKNSGFIFPNKAITVNLAPADLKKEGAYFDLVIALSILRAEIEDLKFAEDYVIIGELGLDGLIRPLDGIMSIMISAVKGGKTKFIIPKENAKEASYIQGAETIAVENLAEVVRIFKGEQEIKYIESNVDKVFAEQEKFEYDLCYVKGQYKAKRALEIAVSGGHNLLMVGSPGSGKTMLAKCIPSIMPKMTMEEALETTEIHSVAGKLSREKGIVATRPFMTPHHTATIIALAGGGQDAKPGIISLAHNGVLYMDEMAEYPRNVLECLRQPLEDRQISVARAKLYATYPASFMLCGSMNPCPCGNLGTKGAICNCSTSSIIKYRSKLSAPLLDRIDIQLDIEGVKYEDLSSDKLEEKSELVRKRVNRVRTLQQERFAGDKITTNAQMSEVHIKKYCKLSKECDEVLKAYYEKNNLTARARNRILKVARTIADMEFSEDILPKHLIEACSYRSKGTNERKY